MFGNIKLKLYEPKAIQTVLCVRNLDNDHGRKERSCSSWKEDSKKIHGRITQGKHWGMRGGINRVIRDILEGKYIVKCTKFHRTR
jgi:hypothetical protein